MNNKEVEKKNEEKEKRKRKDCAKKGYFTSKLIHHTLN